MNDKRKPNDPRPEVVTDDMLIYLDELRESGCTNMFGARPFALDGLESLILKHESVPRDFRCADLAPVDELVKPLARHSERVCCLFRI